MLCGRDFAFMHLGRVTCRMQRRLSALARYPEEVQAASIKSKEFYEEHAARREYFYYVDMQARPVFLISESACACSASCSLVEASRAFGSSLAGPLVFGRHAPENRCHQSQVPQVPALLLLPGTCVTAVWLLSCERTERVVLHVAHGGCIQCHP